MNTLAAAILYIIVTASGPDGSPNGWTTNIQFDNMNECLVEAKRMNDLPLVSASCLYGFKPIPMD